MPLPRPWVDRFRRFELIRYLQRYRFLSTLFVADLGLLLLSMFLFFLASDYPKHGPDVSPPGFGDDHSRHASGHDQLFAPRPGKDILGRKK